MASNALIAKPEENQTPATVAPPAREPWWRQWLGPTLAATTINTLVIVWVTVGVAGFNSLKGGGKDRENRLS